MFCENCGNKTARSSKFCDKCGREMDVTTAVLLYYWFAKIGEKTRNLVSDKRKTLFIFLAILLIFAAIGFGIAKYIKNQRTQTAQLESQINAVRKQSEEAQQQNISTTQSLMSQLNAEKDATNKAEQQTQLAQQALSLAKQQPKVSIVQENNTFPSVNTQAIVLIVCFDSSGNPIQSGSGTIINSQGYVLTNKHVITDESTGNELGCGAFMNDGTISPALQTGIIYSLTTDAPGAGTYSNYDAALLKIDGALNTKNSVAASLPNSFPYIKPNGGNLKEGDSLYIFGYPGASNLVFNVTHGIVSSFTPDGLYINTDAVIDHGNSGGAAITADGRLVGIPSQKYSSTDGDYLGQILRIENLNIPQ